MEAGANGANGVSALRQSMAYKQGLENVLIQNQHMVERNAMEPEQSWGSVVTCPAAMKVDKDERFIMCMDFATTKRINWLKIYIIILSFL